MPATIGTFAGSSRFLGEKEISMDENRLEGTARNLGGKVQEGVGRVTGDAKTQAKGVANEVRGKAQDLYGQTADTARDTATSLDSWLRETIETQPYT
ncbi:MAG: CsbD family protein, partial [Xanthobacteraceae bacterium]